MITDSAEEEKNNREEREAVMKKFVNWLLNALYQRVMILLEYEPCDAAQTGYFETLYAMRREMEADTAALSNRSG